VAVVVEDLKRGMGHYFFALQCPHSYTPTPTSSPRPPELSLADTNTEPFTDNFGLFQGLYSQGAYFLALTHPTLPGNIGTASSRTSHTERRKTKVEVRDLVYYGCKKGLSNVPCNSCSVLTYGNWLKRDFLVWKFGKTEKCCRIALHAPTWLCTFKNHSSRGGRGWAGRREHFAVNKGGHTQFFFVSPKSQIRKFSGSFRNHKSANVWRVPVRKSQVCKFVMINPQISYVCQSANRKSANFQRKKQCFWSRSALVCL
jgi:hypothetical protein